MHDITLCACGCGQPTKPYAATNAKLGRIKGQPAKTIKGHMQGSWTPEIGFWKYTTPGAPDECWEWRGTLNDDGYGKFHSRYQRYFAHRVSWEIHRGPIPEGLHVCHSCDNRKCVNPNHLFVGSHLDNMHDRTEKGRGRNPTFYGEDHPTAKLTEVQVREIRSLADQGVPYPEIGQLYGIARSSASRIARRKSWKHLPD